MIIIEKMLDFKDAKVTCDDNVCVLDFGVSVLTLKNDFLKFQVYPHGLRVYTQSKWHKKLDACIGTWQSLINTHAARKLHKYTVSVRYRHFPIKLSLDNNHVLVKNYLGIKNILKVDLKDVMCQLIDNEKIVLSGYDRVKVGNAAAKFDFLIKYTPQKNLDRRVFTDGFNCDYSYDVQ